jgi:hypothetical protein
MHDKLDSANVRSVSEAILQAHSKGAVMYIEKITKVIEVDAGDLLPDLREALPVAKFRCGEI